MRGMEMDIWVLKISLVRKESVRRSWRAVLSRSGCEDQSSSVPMDRLKNMGSGKVEEAEYLKSTKKKKKKNRGKSPARRLT